MDRSKKNKVKTLIGPAPKKGEQGYLMMLREGDIACDHFCIWFQLFGLSFLVHWAILSSVVTSVNLDFDSDVEFYMFNKF